MVENRQTSIMETTIRFFSFFTILTNLLAAIYFTYSAVVNNQLPTPMRRPGILTAITIYITIVGLVYQIALRHIWQPEGLQLIVDELLHSVIPTLVIVFWCMYERTGPVKYRQILGWTIYPLAYLFYILTRGYYANFYPYPFINVASLGMAKALANAGVILVVFIIISASFVFIGKAIIQRK